MNCAGYVRVSTQEQKDDESHKTQRTQLQDWADRNGHQITFFEDIAISGQSDDRAAYQDMMDSAGDFDAIVVRELSRFGRNLQRMLNDIKELQEKDVTFISLKDNLDMGSAQGKLMLQMIGAFNEFWANIARERAIEAVQRRREQGLPIGRHPKLGEAELADVFDWRRRGLSYRQIARFVEAEHGIEITARTIQNYCDNNNITKGAEVQ